jgi:hypothetical protein
MTETSRLFNASQLACDSLKMRLGIMHSPEVKFLPTLSQFEHTAEKRIKFN